MDSMTKRELRQAIRRLEARQDSIIGMARRGETSCAMAADSLNRLEARRGELFAALAAR